MGGRRRRIGVNKEDDMENEIKILQFLANQENGRCIHEKFKKECDTDPFIHLAAIILQELSPHYIVDKDGEYTLTAQGRDRLADLNTMAGFN